MSGMDWISGPETEKQANVSWQPLGLWSGAQHSVGIKITTRLKTPNFKGSKFNVDTFYILLYMSAIFIRNSVYNFGYKNCP